MLFLLLAAVGAMWASYFKKQENPYMHCNMQFLQLALETVPTSAFPVYLGKAELQSISPLQNVN